MSRLNHELPGATMPEEPLNDHEGVDPGFGVPEAVEPYTVETVEAPVAAAEEQSEAIRGRIARLADKVQSAPYAAWARAIDAMSDYQEARAEKLPQLVPDAEGGRIRRAYEHVRRRPMAVLGMGAVAVGAGVIAYAKVQHGLGMNNHGAMDPSSMDLTGHAQPVSAHDALPTGAPKGQMTEVLHGPVHREWVDSNAGGLDFETLKNGNIKVSFDGQSLHGKPSLELMVSDPKGDKALLALQRGPDGTYTQTVDGNSVFGHALHGNDQQYAEVVGRGSQHHGATELHVYSTQEGSGTADIPNKPVSYTDGGHAEAPAHTGPEPRQSDTPTLPAPEKSPTTTSTPSETPAASSPPSSEAAQQPIHLKQNDGEAQPLQGGQKAKLIAADALSAGAWSLLTSTISGTLLHARRRHKLMGNKFKNNVVAGLRTTVTLPRSTTAFVSGLALGAVASPLVEGTKGLVGAAGTALPFLRRVHLGRKEPGLAKISPLIPHGVTRYNYEKALAIERAVLKQNVVGVRLDKQGYPRTGGFVLPGNEILKRGENLVELDNLAFTTLVHDLRSKREADVVDKLLERAYDHTGDDKLKERFLERRAIVQEVWQEEEPLARLTPDPTPPPAPLPPPAPQAPAPNPAPEQPDRSLNDDIFGPRPEVTRMPDEYGARENPAWDTGVQGVGLVRSRRFRAPRPAPAAPPELAPDPWEAEPAPSAPAPAPAPQPAAELSGEELLDRVNRDLAAQGRQPEPIPSESPQLVPGPGLFGIPLPESPSRPEAPQPRRPEFASQPIPSDDVVGAVRNSRIYERLAGVETALEGNFDDEEVALRLERLRETVNTYPDPRERDRILEELGLDQDEDGDSDSTAKRVLENYRSKFKRS